MRELEECLTDQAAGRARATRDRPGGTREVTTGVSAPPVVSPSTALHLQRLVGNATVCRLAGEDEPAEECRSPVLDVVGRGGGVPLDAGVRHDMESRLGHDFSDVRVHTDSGAASSARAVAAHAYTVGNEVVFDSGRYSPGTDAGRHTLAHELTHVVQQRQGPVEGTPAGGGIQLSDPSDHFEREAEHTARQALAGEPPASVAAAGAVQRDAAPGEEEEKKDDDVPGVQGSFVQRDEETGESQEA